MDKLVEVLEKLIKKYEVEEADVNEIQQALEDIGAGDLNMEGDEADLPEMTVVIEGEEDGIEDEEE